MQPKIIFEDQWILVLDKPAGLVVSRADSVKLPTLEDILQESFGLGDVERSGIVHRLDKDTSGVILVAKNNEIKLQLQAMFADRTVKKQYVALVHGELKESVGVINKPIMRNPQNREKFAVMESGRESVTEYATKAQYLINLETVLAHRDHLTKKEKAYFETHASKYTLVELFPKTGRTHQIRVHMQHLGHPLVSDSVYLNKKLWRLDHTWCPRHFLHAMSVTLLHPVSKELLTYSSPLSQDLEGALSVLTAE